MSANLPTTSVLLPPNGLEQIIASFGDIYSYIQPDHSLYARWQAEALDLISLPFPLPLSWDKSQSVIKMRCHKLLGSIFTGVFSKIQSAGLHDRLTTFGGCFSFRPQRTGTKLSAHAWGIAIDLNPETNQQGSTGNMDPAIIAIFRDAGFQWGGTWQGKSRDPMHFQFCTGY